MPAKRNRRGTILWIRGLALARTVTCLSAPHLIASEAYNIRVHGQTPLQGQAANQRPAWTRRLTTAAG